MEMNNVIQLWLTTSLFFIGVVIFLLGLWILIAPGSFLRIGQYLGSWVNTEKYFDAIDKPRFQEGLLYRQHRWVGGLIFVGALYTLLMLLLKVNINILKASLPVIGNAYVSEWLYGSIYSILVVANVFALIIGVVVFARPSMLKWIESILNRWIYTEKKLKKLDVTHEISIDIFPGGNPRLFGLAVALGGLYISLSMGVMLL